MRKDIKSVDLFKMDNNIKSDIKNDIDDISNNSNDIKVDSSDIIIDIDDENIELNVPVLLRLKHSTVKELDNIAHKARKSRNFMAQMLLDKAIAKVKFNKK